MTRFKILIIVVLKYLSRYFCLCARVVFLCVCLEIGSAEEGEPSPPKQDPSFIFNGSASLTLLCTVSKILLFIYCAPLRCAQACGARNGARSFFTQHLRASAGATAAPTLARRTGLLYSARCGAGASLAAMFGRRFSSSPVGRRSCRTQGSPLSIQRASRTMLSM